MGQTKALNTLTGGYTLGGTTEGIKATLPNTVVTGTEPIDYTLNTITGGEGLKVCPCFAQKLNYLIIAYFNSKGKYL